MSAELSPVQLPVTTVSPPAVSVVKLVGFSGLPPVIFCEQESESSR